MYKFHYLGCQEKISSSPISLFDKKVTHSYENAYYRVDIVIGYFKTDPSDSTAMPPDLVLKCRPIDHRALLFRNDGNSIVIADPSLLSVPASCANQVAERFRITAHCAQEIQKELNKLIYGDTQLKAAYRD